MDHVTIKTDSEVVTNGLLTVKGLSKSYHQGHENLEILKDVDLAIKPQEMVGLLGPSGSGKSTLLQVVGLLDKPSSGQITINGKDVQSLSEHKRTLLRLKHVGFVYQFHYLLPEFSACENLIIPQMINGVGLKKAKENALELLQKIGLDHRAEHRPARLSGGEQQRVAIARALVNKPSLLLADEPTGNLDPATSEIIFDLLISIVRDTQTSALIATHNIDLACKMDRVFELKDQKLHLVNL